ncbi:MgtC/SapB family protein [Rhizobium sp.]|uniref:MgtC/SapB family protein n=1 Tax=Rhizobium sp. TaxID=391 RepID=UPI002899859D
MDDDGTTTMTQLSDLMPITPDWPEICIRIVATLVAGVCLGINRERGGHAAGLRTTVLVGLAACVSMIQANLLLSTSQAVNGSMDILRFPLGVLTGVGFIGGGAILRRGDIATGVTTAATLWMMTAIGLSFGGGQLVIGAAASVIAFITLSPMKTLGLWVSSEQKGSIGVCAIKTGGIPDLCPSLPAGVEASFVALRPIDANKAQYLYELRWRTKDYGPTAADIVRSLQTSHDVVSFEHRTTIT